MVDITAKRGPIDPNDYVTNQGVATQGQIKALDRDIRYHENQPSTWDRVMGGVKDVMNVATSAMNMYNTYEGIQVQEEQIEASKLNRQKTELEMEKIKQQMKYQGIKNDLALSEYKSNNKFLTDFTTHISNYDYDGALQIALSDPRSAAKNSGMLLYAANSLENMGRTDEASQLRLLASQNMNVDELKKMYELPKGAPTELTQQKLEYEKFKNLASVFQSGILRNGLNTIEEIDTNPRLTLSNDIGNELLQNCEIHPMANSQQVNAINSILNNMSGKDNGLQSLELDDNKNKYQSAQNNLSYAVVSCIDPKDPNKVVDRILAYDGKAKQQVPKLDKYGNITGDSETITNEEIVNRLASTQTKAKNARDNLMKAPNTNPDTTPNKDVKKGEKTNTNTSTKFSELPKTTQEIISKNNNKSFDEYQKDMREEITKNSVPDEQGNTVIGKDIVNWGLEDLKDKVVKILQKDPDLSNSAEKIAEQEVWVAANKANDYFKVNDITEPTPQDITERIEYILSEKYSELNSTQDESKNMYKKDIKNLDKESDESKLNNEKVYDAIVPKGSVLFTGMYERGIKDLKEDGLTTSITFNEVKQAVGDVMKKAINEKIKADANKTPKNATIKRLKNSKKINSIEDIKDNITSTEVTIIMDAIVPKLLKTSYPEIYELLYTRGENYWDRRKKRIKENEIKKENDLKNIRLEKVSQNFK